MALWDRIDAESKEPLKGLWKALPGGLNGIADIVARRQAMSAFRDAAPKAEFPQLAGERSHLPRARWRSVTALVSAESRLRCPPPGLSIFMAAEWSWVT